MFHIFKWQLIEEKWKKYILNDLFWIEVNFEWTKNKWKFYIFPYFDENKKTIKYFAFESLEEKLIYEKLVKISWVWPKIAFLLSQIWIDKITESIKKLDTTVFTKIKWIWPKLAKKILFEIKDWIKLEDIKILDKNEKVTNNIISSLKTIWYDSNKVKNTLKKYNWEFTQENIWNIIKRVITNI